MSQKKGFAVMDPDTQKQIASLGGKTAHSQGSAHEFTPEEAKIAGRKGGLVSSENKRMARQSQFHQIKRSAKR